MWTVSLPLRIPVSKNKVFLLNLNSYRNTHFQILNKAKVLFEEVVRPLLKSIPVIEECTLEYTLYPGTSHLSDVSNICSIVDKFFCDTLVSAGKLADDNYTVVKSVKYLIGSIDRINPRVDVVIHSLKEIDTMKQSNQKEEDMQIQVTLVQVEIEEALRNFISTQMTLKEGTAIEIDLAATRGADGIKATINLIPPSNTQATPATAPTVAAKETVKETKAPKATPAPVEEVKPKEAVEEGQAASTDGAPVESGNAESATDSTYAANEEKPADSVTVVTTDEAAPAVKPSLFAGLRKPVNQ